LRLKRIVIKPPYLEFGKRDGTSDSGVSPKRSPVVSILGCSHSLQESPRLLLNHQDRDYYANA
jgi:hypothetical protein